MNYSAQPSIEYSQKCVSRKETRRRHNKNQCKDNQLYGLEGWLHCFILECLYGRPILLTWMFYMKWNELGALNSKKVTIAMLLAIVETLFLIYLSIRTGLAMKHLKPDAVPRAKRFLLFSFVGPIIPLTIALVYGKNYLIILFPYSEF